MTQQPGFYRRRVGGLVVTAVNDGVLALPLDALLDIGEAEAAALLEAAARPLGPVATVNTFLIEGHGRTILVDTGGGGLAPSTGRMLGNLVAAGVEPGAVDLVLLTHLHSDHSGMLTGPGGEAVFPTAVLGLAAAEAGFWLDAANEAAAPEARRPSFAAARAAVAPYHARMRLLEAGTVVDGVTLVPLPGHTPGHSGYLVADGGAALLIWGDVMHVPAVQGARPGVAVTYDTDPVLAVATRRGVLERAVAEGLAVAGMHLDFPGFAQVRRAGDGYAVVAEAWSPVV